MNITLSSKYLGALACQDTCSCPTRPFCCRDTWEGGSRRTRERKKDWKIWKIRHRFNFFQNIFHEREMSHSGPPQRQSVCRGCCCHPPHPGEFPRTKEYPSKEKHRCEGMFPLLSFELTFHTSASSFW